MKRKGPHQREALTGKFVHAIQVPGFYADGNGLYLRVDRMGSKRWILRTVVRGKRQDLGLGGCSCISLLEARAKARILRRVARDGGDPLAARSEMADAFRLFAIQAMEAAIERLRAVGVDPAEVSLGN